MTASFSRRADVSVWMQSFFVVTPCGGSIEEVQQTVCSVKDVAAARPSTAFQHHLVFNNGLTPDHMLATEQSNYQCKITDLGDVASRAQARNVALDDLAAASAKGLVCFLDAGDLLLNEGAIEQAFDDLDRLPPLNLRAFAGRIVGANLSSARRPRPLWTRKVGNPFFIGATFVSTELATTTRFSEGSKEDWKYWLELLELDPHIELRNEIAYEYQVVSVTDHLRKKQRLLRTQYDFFADYLGYGHGIRTTLSMIAHIALAGGSWVRRLPLPGRKPQQ